MSEENGLATPAETPVASVVPETPVVDQPIDLDASPPEETKPETEAKPEETKAEEAPAEAAEETERKKVPGSQKLKRRLQLIEADYEAAQAKAADLEKRLAQYSAPKADDGKPGVDREPREADYPNDYLAYERAMISWNTRQSVREEFARLQQAHQQDQTERQRREIQIERQEEYDEQASVARERIPDFDKTINSASDIKITNPELVDEIMASPKAALIHYHLAKNPEQARELNALKGKELAREVGRLEAKVHLPQAKKATEAAPPPSTPKGGAAQPFNLHHAAETDINAYVAYRNKQEAQERRR